MSKPGPRPYILAETNWREVKDTKYEVAVLPWGATEAHNYHLPYATDNIQCDYIAAEAARLAWEHGKKVIVLPTIPFGVNTGQHDVKLDMNMNPSTQLAIIRDVMQVLERQKIKKLIILNGHGGNDFKQMVREVGLESPGVFISTCHWFKAVNWKEYFTEMGDHAGEMETSVMLHVAPELVLPLSEAGKGNAKKFKIDSLNENWAWAERQWTKVSDDTGIGDPSHASAEKGAAYLEAVIDKLSHLFIEMADANIDDLYH